MKVPGVNFTEFCIRYKGIPANNRKDNNVNSLQERPPSYEP